MFGVKDLRPKRHLSASYYVESLPYSGTFYSADCVRKFVGNENYKNRKFDKEEGDGFTIQVKTNNGWIDVDLYSYIVKGVKAELYVYDRYVFHKMFQQPCAENSDALHNLRANAREKTTDLLSLLYERGLVNATKTVTLSKEESDAISIYLRLYRGGHTEMVERIVQGNEKVIERTNQKIKEQSEEIEKLRSGIIDTKNKDAKKLLGVLADRSLNSEDGSISLSGKESEDVRQQLLMITLYKFVAEEMQREKNKENKIIVTKDGTKLFTGIEEEPKFPSKPIIDPKIGDKVRRFDIGGEGTIKSFGGLCRVAWDLGDGRTLDIIEETINLERCEDDKYCATEEKDRIEDNDQMYCTNCGNDEDFSFVSSKANTNWYKCNNCGEDVTEPNDKEEQ